MGHVTQGTVQVELDGTAIKFRINPTQNFTFKYREKDYIVSVSEGDPLQDAKVFEKTAQFTTANTNLMQALTTAASQKTKIEIDIDFSKTPQQIVSIKIPATL